MIFRPDNALISRVAYAISTTRILIEETWDLTHKDSPFCRPPNSERTTLCQRILMSAAEFRAIDPPLKSSSQPTKE